MEKIDGRIKTVMSAVFEIPIDKIDINSTSKNVDSWDSLKHLNLMLALEEEFNIAIPDEKMASLTSYAEILKVIENIKSK